jgi:hypothetical protein
MTSMTLFNHIAASAFLASPPSRSMTRTSTGTGSCSRSRSSCTPALFHNHPHYSAVSSVSMSIIQRSATKEDATANVNHANVNVNGSISPSIHQDADGKCVYGQKSYWDDMYTGNASDSGTTTSETTSMSIPSISLPSTSYSWYCGWNELEPFWSMSDYCPTVRNPMSSLPALEMI